MKICNNIGEIRLVKTQKRNGKRLRLQEWTALVKDSSFVETKHLTQRYHGKVGTVVSIVIKASIVIIFSWNLPWYMNLKKASAPLPSCLTSMYKWFEFLLHPYFLGFLFLPEVNSSHQSFSLPALDAATFKDRHEGVSRHLWMHSNSSYTVYVPALGTLR